MKQRLISILLIAAASLVGGCAALPSAWLVRIGSLQYAVRLGKEQPTAAPVAVANVQAAPVAVQVIASTGYAYIGPPTISREVYQSVFCDQNGTDSVICQEAPSMYNAIVAEGVDPAVELAHAGNESSFGTGGVGMAPWFNLHGIHCHTDSGIGRCFRNTAPGDEDMQEYDSYPDAVADWIHLMKYGGLYYPARNTPEQVLEIYCECDGAVGKAEYVQRMKAQIDGWRAQSMTQVLPVQQMTERPAITEQVMSNPITVDDSSFGINVRAALTANDNALQNVTIQPGETWSFNASVGNPALLSLATIVHPGDGWCNLAARYAQVSRALGLTPQFEDHHAGDLGGGPENSVAIWNIGGEPGFEGGRQDLMITNTTNRIVRFQAQEMDSGVIIVASAI